MARGPLPIGDRNMGDHQIEFQPVGRRGPCLARETLLDCARRLGIELVSLCGGMGKCRGCKIRVMEGRFSEVNPAEQKTFTKEELESGWRLACQTYPKSDCRVYVPPESLSTQQRIQVEGRDVDVPLDPSIRSIACKIEPPSLAKPAADAENLLEKIRAPGPIDLDVHVLKGLSTRLREWNWNLTAHIRNRELIAVSPPNSRPIGLAVDLGSTKIAGFLIDLETGKRLVSQGIMNPQISKGEDIIARINFAIRQRTYAPKRVPKPEISWMPSLSATRPCIT